MKKDAIKISVIGDEGVGKTTMLTVYKDRRYDKEYMPYQINLYSTTIFVKQKHHTVILQDGSGSGPNFDDTDVFIICYAIDDENSWKNVREKWVCEFMSNHTKAKFVIAGTKSDLTSERKLPKEDARLLSESLNADGFIENSSKLGKNVEETILLALMVALKSFKKVESCRLI